MNQIQNFLNLSQNLGVALSLLGTDYSIDASLEISNQESTFISQNQYIDLDLIVPRILATKNTLLCNNFSGTLFVELGKDKQKIRCEDDMHTEIAMDAGTLLTVVCTLIETIVGNTGVPAKIVVRHIKSMIKAAEKHMSEMRSGHVE